MYCFLLITLLLTATIAIADFVDLYRWNGCKPVYISPNNVSDYIYLSPTSATYFIVHGWTENGTQEPYIQIAKNYHQLDSESNIFLVDYGKLASEMYTEARTIVDEAGTSLGNKIIVFLRTGIIGLHKIHMFGHSLGTHVCGKAAKVINAAMQRLVPRISASDPAGPLFRLPIGIGDLDPLQKTETSMLDITHTSYAAGTLEPFGTVDTYVDLLNGNQPACPFALSEDELMYCGHRMARAYFTESILSCGFKQRKSLLDANSGDIVYGQHMNLTTNGVYFMTVNAEPPYAQGNTSCSSIEL